LRASSFDLHDWTTHSVEAVLLTGRKLYLPRISGTPTSRVRQREIEGCHRGAAVGETHPPQYWLLCLYEGVSRAIEPNTARVVFDGLDSCWAKHDATGYGRSGGLR